jgi:hypothetical protein
MPNSLGDRFSEKAEALVGAPNDFDSLRICQSVERFRQSSPTDLKKMKKRNT